MPKTPYRLLIVDDDPLVRRTLVRVLQNRGFGVDDAGDGLSALALIRASSQPYDLLITDVVMPGMSGLELVEYAEDVSPDTRFLLISAYLPETFRLEGLPFLQKPFGMDTFLGKVRDLCESWNPRENHSPPLFLHK